MAPNAETRTIDEPATISRVRVNEAFDQPGKLGDSHSARPLARSLAVLP
jgi:hypothetical protein